MTGFENLTEEEVAFLIEMFNTVKFNKVKMSCPMTEFRLRFVRDVFIQGCLGALMRSNKKELSESSKEVIQSILHKNMINEIVIELI